jgi:hypothetical protein
VRVVRVEAELQDDHAGEAERVAQALDRRRDDPRSSAMIGRPRRGRSRGVERRAPGPRTHRPGRRVGRAARDRPVRDEPAEVVDPREVEEVEDAPEALDPPAVAPPPQRRPVVDRVAPELALRREVVGRRAGDDVVAEQLRVRRVVGAAGAT